MVLEKHLVNGSCVLFQPTETAVREKKKRAKWNDDWNGNLSKKCKESTCVLSRKRPQRMPLNKKALR